jgi:hypothetical protein
VEKDFPRKRTLKTKEGVAILIVDKVDIKNYSEDSKFTSY